jgi:hypothetical protein
LRRSAYGYGLDKSDGDRCIRKNGDEIANIESELSPNIDGSKSGFFNYLMLTKDTVCVAGMRKLLMRMARFNENKAYKSKAKR